MHVFYEQLIPSSTIQLIVEELNSLDGMCLQYTKSQLKASLQTKTELSETEIKDVLKTLDDVHIHRSCSSSLSTDYKRKQYFEENFLYVHPQPIFLGFDENRKEQYA